MPTWAGASSAARGGSCYRFSLTPGPPPFASAKITPAPSTPLIFAAALPAPRRSHRGRPRPPFEGVTQGSKIDFARRGTTRIEFFDNDTRNNDKAGKLRSGDVEQRGSELA